MTITINISAIFIQVVINNLWARYSWTASIKVFHGACIILPQYSSNMAAKGGRPTAILQTIKSAAPIAGPSGVINKRPL